MLKEYAISNGIPSEKIFVTKDVGNTAGKAVAVKELISPRKSIIHVTSAYYMFRAKCLFEKQRFSIIPYKVDYKILNNSKTTLMDFLPSAGILEETEMGIIEILGSIFYFIQIKG